MTDQTTLTTEEQAEIDRVAKVAERAPVAQQPLLAAAGIVAGAETTADRPVTFLRRTSKWHRHLNSDDRNRLWEVAVLCHLRDAFRAGDIWLAHSRRYGDLKDALVPAEVARATPRLAMPFEPEIWLADRKSRSADGLQRLARAARAGAIPGGSIVKGPRLEPIEAGVSHALIASSVLAISAPVLGVLKIEAAAC